MFRIFTNLLLQFLLFVYSTSVFADNLKVISLFLHAPDDIISVTHGGQVGLATFPEAIPSLANTDVADTLLLTNTVRDESGKVVGIASELEYFPEVPMQPESVWDTYWLVVIPGRGSLYAYHQESLGSDAYEVFKRAAGEAQGWSGQIKKISTVGPMPGNKGRIMGGTQEFEGAQGTFIEVADLRKLTAQGELHAVIELRFVLDDGIK